MPQLADAGPPPVLHRPEDAADQLGVSRAQIFDLMKRGEIESVKIGRLRRIPHVVLVAYVERLRAEQATDRASA